MSRTSEAAALLEAWAPPDAGQDRLRGRFVAHLDAHHDGLDRSCRPDHLTAGALVLSHNGTHVLLTLHRRARRWFQLGGHIEPADPGLLAAAAREAAEESGIPDLTVHPEPLQLSEHTVEFCGAPGRVQHLDVRFLAQAGRGVVPLVSEESLDVRWWPVDALPEPEPELAELVALGLARAQSMPGGGSIREAADQPSR